MMEQVLELRAILVAIYKECGSLVHTKLLEAAVPLVQIVRKTLILHDCMMMVCFVWAFSFFGTGLILCFPWAFESRIHVHPALFFSAVMLVLSSAVIYYGWREATWLEAIGIHPTPNARKTARAPPPIDPRELTALIEELLDQKIAKLERSQRAASTAERSEALDRPTDRRLNVEP